MGTPLVEGRVYLYVCLMLRLHISPARSRVGLPSLTIILGVSFPQLLEHDVTL